MHSHPSTHLHTHTHTHTHTYTHLHTHTHTHTLPPSFVLAVFALAVQTSLDDVTLCLCLHRRRLALGDNIQNIIRSNVVCDRAGFGGGAHLSGVDVNGVGEHIAKAVEVVGASLLDPFAALEGQNNMYEYDCNLDMFDLLHAHTSTSQSLMQDETTLAPLLSSLTWSSDKRRRGPVLVEAAAAATAAAPSLLGCAAVPSPRRRRHDPQLSYEQS